MLSSGFTNAPISRWLLIAVVAGALLTSVTDTKYYFWIAVRPHLRDYWQFWRLLTWQLCYTNSTEVLFAAMTLYQLRVVERLWGSRKFGVSVRHAIHHEELCHTDSKLPVLPHLHITIYDISPSPTTGFGHTSTLVRLCQLLTGRSYAHDLRSSGTISRRDPVYVQIPAFSLIFREHAWNHSHFEVDFVPAPLAAYAVSAARKCSCGWCGMARGLRVQKRDPTRSDELEGT